MKDFRAFRNILKSKNPQTIIISYFILFFNFIFTLRIKVKLKNQPFVLIVKLSHF